MTSTGMALSFGLGTLKDDRLIDRLAAAIIVLLAGIAVVTFRDYGLGWDDYTHAQYGDLLLSLYGSGFMDRRAFQFVNLYMYGGGFDLLAELSAKILPFDVFETRRLVGGAVGIAGLFITWRLARRIGGPTAGLIALVLLAICPLYYGHMFINAKDAPFAVAMTLLLLGLVRAFEEFPRPSPSVVLLVGIGAGLSIGSRIMGGLALIYIIGALVLIAIEETRDSGWRYAGHRIGVFVLHLAPALVLAYVVMGLVWPWGVAAPLNPLRAIAYFSHFFEKPWKELFAGALISVPDMPRTYLPMQFGGRMPIIFSVLGLAGIALAFIGVLRRNIALPRRATLLLLMIAATFPIVLAMAVRPPMYNGLRHFVFVTPPIAVVGGLAGAELISRLARYGPRAKMAGIAALLIGVAMPVSEFIRLHPYEYTHFNLLAGGIDGADERYMLDYWGLSLKEASQQLRETLSARSEKPPAGRDWKVALCGPHPAAEVWLGPDFETSWNPKNADFAMMLGEFYCATLNAPVLVEIKREDVVFARVYDIRGRTISSLFTIPPVE